MVEKNKSESVSYILGIISIVLAFFQPLAGLVFGIIGFIQSRKGKTDLLKKAKKLNIIGIILSVIIFIISIIITIYLTSQGISNLANFPVS